MDNIPSVLESDKELTKKVIKYVFEFFIRDLKQVQSLDEPFRDFETLEDLLLAYETWDLDLLTNSFFVKEEYLKGNE